MKFETLINDIEKLTNRKLCSIKPGSEITITCVDKEKGKIVIRANNGNQNTCSFSKMGDLWDALMKKAIVHVDSELGGSGSSRNQPETILANLPYIEHLKFQGKKHIAYVAENTHELGTLKEMSEQNLKQLMQKRAEAVSSSRHIPHPRNLIFFGAPGTGKSFQLNKCAKENFSEDNIRRVTFYPEYTYSQFVGCFKPVTEYEEPDEDELHAKPKPVITYRFVPGPFLETYVKAWQNPRQNFLLIVEEINRAHPAAVFGDLFQLLDRDAQGRSEYEVVTPYEMHKHLEIRLPEFADRTRTDPANLTTEYDRLKARAAKLQLPPNLYIWATMNSADQGVFPMDTAFKRRWGFRYMGIDDGEGELEKLPPVKLGEDGRLAAWNDVRKGINAVLLRAKVNEDKLLGPFFIRPEDVEDSERFPGVFKEKVLLYLYEDAGRNKRGRIFADENATYSQICDGFDRLGVGVFKDFPEPTYIEPEDGKAVKGDADDQDAVE